MNDLFEKKAIRPMLIGESAEAFDSPDYIFELKLDGERCIAYLDPDAGTELRNKRDMKMLGKVPELTEIHRQVKKRCILDGELTILVDGKPSFPEIQRRSLTSDPFKIRLQSARYPAGFIAFDLLHDGDREVTGLPLMERRKLLEETVTENGRLAVSRYVERHGVALYQQAERMDLEGVVAKRKNSRYFFDRRTRDWIKIKNLKDDDFVICGYLRNESGSASVALGQYRDGALISKGRVTLGISAEDLGILDRAQRRSAPPFPDVALRDRDAVWLEPALVCTVKYMTKTASGSMRQPVFKGLRQDKAPGDCMENSSAQR